MPASRARAQEFKIRELCTNALSWELQFMKRPGATIELKVAADMIGHCQLWGCCTVTGCIYRCNALAVKGIDMYSAGYSNGCGRAGQIWSADLPRKVTGSCPCRDNGAADPDRYHHIQRNHCRDLVITKGSRPTANRTRIG